jgi:hypothetical protein
MAERIISHNPCTYIQNAIHASGPAYDIRQVRLVVDSRERNTRLFPHPNSYEINIPNAIMNVSRMKLIASSFPFSSYLINANNNLLHFRVGATDYTAAVEVGDYSSGTDLADAIEAALNAAYGATAFEVTHETRKDNFKFRSTAAFTLLFAGTTFVHPFNDNNDVAYREKTIAQVIGFANTDYASSVVSANNAYINTVLSPFKKNFDLNDQLVVNVEMAQLNKSTAEAVNESFAIISKGGVFDSKAMIYDTHQICKLFTPPIKRLTKLKVWITDYYGNAYDFQNQNHRMEFLIDSQILKPL